MKDVSGQQWKSAQVDKERRDNGLGKKWEDDGSIYIGEYKNGYKTKGRKYELQRDGTYTQYTIKYEENGEEIEKRQVSKSHKMA